MRQITDCLNPSLAKLCSRVIELESLTAMVQLYLPKASSRHCVVGSFNKGCLVLVVTDPVWASELRYSLPELRDRLRRDAKLHQLITIKINMILTTDASAPAPKKHASSPRLTADARETILSGGSQCDYPPLKQALNHLARQ
jgi:hypothetical protein